MMSGIRGKDTKPEMFIRRHLFARGFRYRLHAKQLPGKPDLVFPKYHAVIFVHGCFWHGHEGCRLFKLPGTRTDFWREKIGRNIANDAKALERLKEMHWRVAVVWECAIRNRAFSENHLIPQLETWIRGTEEFFETGILLPRVPAPSGQPAGAGQ
jgi:DNA mismatch endonuclease (patch repair protein)